MIRRLVALIESLSSPAKRARKLAQIAREYDAGQALRVPLTPREWGTVNKIRADESFESYKARYGEYLGAFYGHMAYHSEAQRAVWAQTALNRAPLTDQALASLLSRSWGN